MKIAAMFLAAACLLLAADEPAKTQKKDVQQKFEPRSGPGAGQKYLEKFVGEWHVAKAFFPRTGEPSRSEGRCRQTMIQDGRFLQSEFVFEQNGRKSTGMGLIGFEPETSRFTSFWIDSRQTRMSVRQSRDKFDGEQIVLFSKSLEPDGKEARKSRTVSKVAPDGKTITHRQFNIGADGKEALLMELVMTKEGDSKK